MIRTPADLIVTLLGCLAFTLILWAAIYAVYLIPLILNLEGGY